MPLTSAEQTTMNTQSATAAANLNAGKNADGTAKNTATASAPTVDPNIANQGKPGYTVFGEPVAGTPLAGGGATYVPVAGNASGAPSSPVTSMSSSNIQPVVDANNQTMNNIASAPKGNQADTNGVERYSNGNLVTAPSDAVQETDENGKPISVWKGTDGKTYAISPGSTQMDPTQKAQNDEIERLKSQASATLVTTLSNIQKQYNDLITKQNNINSGAQAGLDTALLMGGSSRYSASSEGISAGMKSFGVQQISELVDKENNAIAAAQAAYDTGNNKLVDAQLKIAKDASDNQQKVAQAILENLAKSQAEVKAKQDQQNIDTGVASQLSNGVTDPAKIIKNLAAQGITVNAKQIADSIDNLNPHAKEVNSILTEAIKNGASPEVLKAIGQAKDLNGAIAAAGKFMQDPTSNAGQYQTAVQGGYKGTYQDWFAANEYKKQYAQSLASANAKAEADRLTGANGSSATGIVSSDSEDVLSGRNTLYNIRQSMGRSSKSQKYMEDLRLAIKKTDPSFDFVASDAGGKFMSSAYYQKNVSSINSAVADVKIATDLSDQISRVGIKGLEALLQSGSVQINNKKVANLSEARKLLADSIGIALGQGSVSDRKLQLGLDITDPSVSNDVFFSNMGIVKQFLENRKQALEDQRYKSSTPASQTPEQIDAAATQKIVDFRKADPANEKAYNTLANDPRLKDKSPTWIMQQLGLSLNK